jgi:hypothetical protein
LRDEFLEIDERLCRRGSAGGLCTSRGDFRDISTDSKMLLQKPVVVSFPKRGNAMTPLQKRIHEEALKRSQNFKRAEWPLIEILQRVASENVHRQAGQPSLFAYANKVLGLSESLSNAFTNVAVKAMKIPRLSTALREHRFSVTKIIRITSVMTLDNADELIELATRATNRELDRKSAELQPGKSRRTSKKPISETESRLSFDVSNETLELLARAKELLTKKESKTENEILHCVLEEWLERHDPVRKAARATKKKKESCASKAAAEPVVQSQPQPAQKPYGRIPLTAEQRHAVNHRDAGQCTALHENGERCEHTKWIDIHHIVPVSKGGSNDPSNLRTLCWFHHDLIHQLSLPLEGQSNRIRAPQLEYRVMNSDGRVVARKRGVRYQLQNAAHTR